MIVPQTRTLGLSVACRTCGKMEFFEGGLLHSVAALRNSPRWYVDEKNFAQCKECFYRRKAGEVS